MGELYAAGVVGETQIVAVLELQGAHGCEQWRCIRVKRLAIVHQLADDIARCVQAAVICTCLPLAFLISEAAALPDRMHTIRVGFERGKETLARRHRFRSSRRGARLTSVGTVRMGDGVRSFKALDVAAGPIHSPE